MTKKILLIGDSTEDCRRVRDHLVDAGFSVSVISYGKALNVLKNTTPDLIVIDEGNGESSATNSASIREYCDIEDIPILVLAKDDSITSVSIADTLVDDEILYRPFEQDHLVRKVNRLAV